jgi:probable rRNA maturation factor
VIELNNLTGEVVSSAFFKKVAQSVLRQEKKNGAGMSVVFVGEKRIQELSRIYKKKDKVVNVLSFPFNDVQGRPIPEMGLGEVILCPAEIRKDAKKYGISYTKGMAWMLIHGILHLLGYTHRQMINREKQYLSRVS